MTFVSLSLSLPLLPVLRFLYFTFTFVLCWVVFASLFEVAIRWRLNIGGFCRTCSSYSVGGTHFMVFLCSSITEAVKGWGRWFSKIFFWKNFFQKLLPEVDTAYSGRSSSGSWYCFFRKNFFRKLYFFNFFGIVFLNLWEN